jgi:hypothetical protein
MNPGITAFGDLVGQLGVDGDGVMPGSTMYLRSAELEFRADVDPFAKADAVISFEQESPPLAGGPSSGFEVGPEEAYVDLVSLPAHLTAKIGKFKVPFGAIGRTHPHDLPWTDVPGAIAILGGDGAYNDTGGDLSWLIPMGGTALTATAGAFAGEPWDPAGVRASITGFGRLELFTGFQNVELGFGGSILKDTGSDLQKIGGDFTFRWRPNPRRSLVVLAEAYHGENGDFGGYGSVQVQAGRSVYIGAREDLLDGDLQHNLYVTYYTSEFLRFRVGGGYAPASQQGDALAQLTFVWGSHPVEPWWVNK